MPWWLTLLASILLVLAAAKAHGRQVRLEREQKGFFAVDFGKENPPGVEAVWRGDRRVFWPLFAALVLAILAWLGHSWSTTGIRPGGDELAIYPAWAFAAAFIVAGLASWFRIARREDGDAAWHRSAYRGSIAWWCVVATAAALVASTMRF